MKRILVSMTLPVGLFLAAAARPASAQLSVSAHLSWHWTDGGWRASPITEGYVEWRDVAVTRRARRVVPVYSVPARLRVPPGHMPPPGMCRLWVIGRPPGHQPRPDTCARVFRMRPRPGVVVLHSPARWERRWWEGRWDREGRWIRDDDVWERDGRWDRDGHWNRGEDRPGRSDGRPGRGPGRARSSAR